MSKKKAAIYLRSLWIHSYADQWGLICFWYVSLEPKQVLDQVVSRASFPPHHQIPFSPASFLILSIFLSFVSFYVLFSFKFNLKFGISYKEELRVDKVKLNALTFAVHSLRHVWLFVIPGTAAYQASLSIPLSQCLLTLGLFWNLLLGSKAALSNRTFCKALYNFSGDTGWVKSKNPWD